MNRDQQEATRELEAAQEKWLHAYGWRRELGGRWVHAHHEGAVTRFDALTLTRAQPLLFGTSRSPRK